MSVVGLAAHVLLLLVVLLHCALSSSLTWILVQYLRYRHSSLRAEAQLLRTPLPADPDLPHVLVQLPIYNEDGLVERAAAAVAALDWPRDRLHLQILDDSTGEARALAATAAERVSRTGIDAKVLHRESRTGFKAGALGEGLRASDAPFVAVFDVDYVPPPQFLRACIRPMLADPRVALVQARLDFLNGDENALTRAQQRSLDAHYGVEQPVRGWTGQVLPFNGTGGIWRRAAIEDAGGWRGDTLAEDLDLSYRVQLRGWRGCFLFTLAVPGELPTTFEAWRRQQFRWLKGSSQVGRTLSISLWRSPLPVGKKLISQAQLADNLYMPLHLAELVLCVIDFSIGAGVTGIVLGGLALAFLQEIGGLAGIIVAGQKFVRGERPWRTVVQLPAVILLEICGLLLQLPAVGDVLFGRSSPFVRTPKHGAARWPGMSSDRER